MGLLFYPRGGSAQVVRYLAAALTKMGRSVSLVTGSLGPPGAPTDARVFFEGLDVHPVDFTPAYEAWRGGGNPMRQPVPMHPSYEERDGVPDRIFTDLDDEEARLQVEAWGDALALAGGDRTGLFHLHHLTPLHMAVAERWPDAPVVTHLHGTELKMIDRLDPTEPWRLRLTEMARRSDRIITISEHDRGEAVRLLGVDPAQLTIIANGVDTSVFDDRPTDTADRLSRWRRWLVEDPRGWDVSGEPGSVRYSEQDLSAFTDHRGDPLPVLIFVGRFLAFKQVPLLIRAYAAARQLMDRPSPLVIWGGSPGEWEGEHPVEVARSIGCEGVFFTGWRGHDELPHGLNSADVLVAPSIDEPFGQVYLEAMACGLPVIATKSGGPLGFVNTEPGAPNGWMVEPGDIMSLAHAMADAANDTAERERRGDAAWSQIRADFSWNRIALQVAAVYDEVLTQR